MSPVLTPVLAHLAERGRRKIHLGALVEATGHTRKQCLRAMDKLAAEGYVVELSDDPIPPALGEVGPPRRNPTWKVVEGKDPLARASGPVTRDRTLRGRMWALIRMRRKFTRSDLEVLADVGHASADTFVKLLCRAGVIRQIGREGREKLYVLVKDTVARPRLPEEGPHA